jgi:hypothetical protein
MTLFLVTIGGRKQRRFNRHFIRKQDYGESPLLPSPLTTHKIGVIPNFSTKRVKYLNQTLSVEK